MGEGSWVEAGACGESISVSGAWREYKIMGCDRGQNPPNALILRVDSVLARRFHAIEDVVMDSALV